MLLVLVLAVHTLIAMDREKEGLDEMNFEKVANVLKLDVRA